MTTIKTITEKKQDMGNNESIVTAGIYLQKDGSYWWLTSTRSGYCKRLSTAQKKISY